MNNFKPMLAATAKKISDLKFPLYASPKLDGVRALVIDGVVVSRSLKPIRNQYVQKLFGRKGFNGYDGELIVGDANAPDVYRITTSAVNRADGKPDVYFHIFDYAGQPYANYVHRISCILHITAFVHLLEVKHISGEDDLLAYEEKLLALGYEGVMLRNANQPYKFGRSTLREAALIKWKRFSDSEAEIVGMVEKMHNTNEAKLNELGQKARSSAKAGMVPTGTLGALIVRDIHSGVRFEIGTGFDEDTRQALWDQSEQMLGQLVKYKFFAVGNYDKPRFPVYLGMRSKDDL